MKKTWLITGTVFAILLFFYYSSTFPVQLAHAQTCTLPTQVQNAAITYPNCDSGGNCNYAEGKCSWDTLANATGYNVVVTTVGASTEVLNQQAITSVSVAFPVATSDTYKCDVYAVNSCGTGPVATSSLLCNTDFVPTATPTATPTVIPTTIPTSIPQATLPPTGSNASVWLGFAGLVIIMLSFSFLLL